MSPRLPPLAALHAFVLVAETGSLSAAAARLNVTQPAIGKRLRTLEASLGVPLLRRGANAVALTEEGARYAAQVTEAFRAIASATETLTARPERPLRVRAYTTWALRWLIPRLARFRERHPGLEVEVTTSTAPVDFARDPVDAAIRTGTDTPPAPGAVRLQAVAVAPFAVAALARRARREGLVGLTLLGSRVRPRDWACWATATDTPLPTQPLLFESTMLAVQAALEGLGAVIVWPVLVEEDMRRRRLVRIGPEPVPTGHHYWLLLPPGTPRPEALAFREWLLEEIAGTG